MDDPTSERITTAEMIEAITMALANARFEGDPCKCKAEEHLAPIEAILQRIARDKKDVERALAREEKALENLDRQAEALVQSHGEEIWRLLGCPDYDPIYNILFPSAATVEAEARAKIERLSLIADLLSNHVHPKIDRAYATSANLEFQTIVEDYQERIYLLSKHQFKKSALDAFEASVARIGLLELGTLRRHLRGMGIDDSLVMTIVPPPVSSRRMGPKSST
ncbi:MAG: hypothetical protein IPM54_31940 [Polyangiaceae bacterium]|nr:hypothetical protein [Polyangiaceae bacterium]